MTRVGLLHKVAIAPQFEHVEHQFRQIHIALKVPRQVFNDPLGRVERHDEDQ